VKHLDMRRRIAHAAARMIAEDGSLDYGSAKRKAARQLGVPESGSLPDNQQIEEALRSYQAIYQADETRELLTLLRQTAIEYMERLADFDPHLTGAVLNGTAGRNADIDLQLFTDQQKDVEFLLMGLDVPYQAGEVRANDAAGRIYPRFVIDDPRASVDVIVYPPSELRNMKRLQADGSPRRARLAQVRSLA
jgi:predicted nucleotidyltransferase